MVEKYTQEEKDFIIINAIAALPAMLESDLSNPSEHIMGQEWVARQAFLMGKAMLEESKKL